MGICSEELRQYVIVPTLTKLGCFSTAAEQLLLGTAAAQSGLGFHLCDHEGIGLYGLSSSVHRRVWDDFLALDADLASQVRGFASQHEFLKAPDIELATNLCYATAIAWMCYQQAGVMLPGTPDVNALARCWWQVFGSQSNLTLQHFIDAYLGTQQRDCVAA